MRRGKAGHYLLAGTVAALLLSQAWVGGADAGGAPPKDDGSRARAAITASKEAIGSEGAGEEEHVKEESGGKAEESPIATHLPATVTLPRILSDEDRRLYQEIFALQRKGDFRAADRRIRRLKDRLLMGHVLYQRYMHPTAYRSRYRELRNWLRHYADHPGAEQVYRLAKRRGGKRARPPRPAPRYQRASRSTGTGVSSKPSTRQDASPTAVKAARSRNDQRRIRAFFDRQKRELRRSHLEHAERYLWAFLRTGLLRADERATAFGQLVRRLFLAGHDDKAAALTDIAFDDLPAAGSAIAQAAWFGGLASWRLKRWNEAYERFSSLARIEGVERNLASAAAFWAARAAWRGGRPEIADAHLMEAVEARESFYGLIAARLFGRPLDFDWRPPELTAEGLAHLLDRPAVRRILALSEIGDTHRADEEMRLLLGRSGDRDWPALAALAARLQLPASQIGLTRLLSDERVTAAMRYPLPDWRPDGGFKLDRALLFAFMRQESKFRTRARSRVGASGLMQVMPATASFVTGDRSLRWRRSRLYEPRFNMAVGQRYLLHLLDQQLVEGNLLMLAAAYNAGPGNLQRWLRKVRYDHDPLLFIEAIPLAETRDYVERVLANFWLYRLQLGQPTPSLDAIAAGAWPVYEPLDERTPLASLAARRTQENELEADDASTASRSVLDARNR
ncbi:MAG: lytic transglycosylase domain-containing protein [Alphaproteobacteria bacterium]|nr:MAG: lytic transglycosylase domain-containing protein [Alphaproteobacteria bacterium]